MWFLAGVTFFFCTLEEYHLNRLDFPCIHGVSEGTMMQFIICIFTACVGQEFWLNELQMFGTKTTYNYIALYSIFTVSMLFSLGSFIKMVTNSEVKIIQVLLNMITYCLLVASLMILIFLSEEESITYQYPKLIIYMYGFIFWKLMVKYSPYLKLSFLFNCFKLVTFTICASSQRNFYAI